MSAIAKNHDYHMVEPSPWPFVMSAAVLIMAVGAIFWIAPVDAVRLLHRPGWRALHDVCLVERCDQGSQYRLPYAVVQMHHRYGMMLFIASEVMVFFGFFWAYFDGFFRWDDVEQYARLAATVALWPPTASSCSTPSTCRGSTPCCC